MNILEIKDLEKLAQKKVPKMFFDYVNSGSWTETTYNENVSDFQKIKLRQRVAIDMSNRTLETEMIGQKVATLLNDYLNINTAGYTVNWDASNLEH